MTPQNPATHRTRRRAGTLALAAVALAGALTCSGPATAGASEARGATATAAAPERPTACGWNKGSAGEHAWYEHCATNTNVWIQVTRWARGRYHRCVGPGRTVLDYDATGAWYDSNYRGGLCSHPGDTGP
ncbi:DUF6355 family natural product biosynthesis protein [Streptomyces sp. NPDC059740]|uniref:DUF6355 family natural product biosynthesis protein n=1 Tax=Streptomyces sp. NPDC059740 TaxID=3346926 RepID=UPI00365648DD